LTDVGEEALAFEVREVEAHLAEASDDVNIVAAGVEVANEIVPGRVHLVRDDLVTNRNSDAPFGHIVHHEDHPTLLPRSRMGEMRCHLRLERTNLGAILSTELAQPAQRLQPALTGLTSSRTTPRR
jgi:hypothetical protein